ncbi:MAG: CRR6 family NdhI maturation factor [Leptolyngbyaceae bacterium]|nr:CRR6 family NdhI maturation factor [Leptolyngbyaceae bacterium]
MSTSIPLTTDVIHRLDLSPVRDVVAPWLASGAIATYAQTLHFEFDYPRDPTDPRELSEVPEIRLWFIALDAQYPWLPYLLDWEKGELSRYAAMLVPHQFNRTEGIQYNPEALEIFVMQKVFTTANWMQSQAIAGRNRLKLMTKTLGYELDDQFFELIGLMS